MLELRLIDRSFINCGPSCGTGNTGKSPKKIVWNTQKSIVKDDIVVFTDYCLHEAAQYTSSNKIALILEPPSVIPHIYQWIEQNHQIFNTVLTFDKELLDISSKFVFSPNATGHWLKDNDIKIHNKNKLISMFASNKRTTDGHQMRHKIASKYKDSIDGLFGRGSYGFLDDKADGLRDYKYHITVENTKKDYYFSEKLIDAFLTGCIPVYYGCPSISNYFNTSGMLIFNTLEEFDMIKKNYIDQNYYDVALKSGYIQDNFNRAMKYLYPEDYMFDILFKE
ncbi:MAG: glycosyltransferase family 10 [Candidatus Nanoarchaeia archaeon]|nr:glycosyltransferase family 10 [Candidatus Nanoarchaeia archaeon]